MNSLDQLGILLADLPVYLANGLLILLYAILGNFAALISAGCAGLIGWRFDQPARQAAGFVPTQNEWRCQQRVTAPCCTTGADPDRFCFWVVAAGAGADSRAGGLDRRWDVGVGVSGGFTVGRPPAGEHVVVHQVRRDPVQPGGHCQPDLPQLHRAALARAVGWPLGFDRYGGSGDCQHALKRDHDCPLGGLAGHSTRVFFDADPAAAGHAAQPAHTAWRCAPDDARYAQPAVMQARECGRRFELEAPSPFADLP